MTKLEKYFRTCASIGHLPSSYIDSMSYEEQILWLCNFLDKEVLPSLKEMQDYFKDLDVQEEINNKLEEMAESGELENIIASYLNTNAIIGFDTLTSLKNATNIANGSFVRTYGKSSLNDGLGAYYKIRTVTSSDSVDEENIVSLTISNTLIAEKICENTIEETTIMIGDSYGVGVTESSQTIESWIPKLKNLLKLNDKTCYSSAEKGAGFTATGVDGHTFLTLLTGLENSISVKNNVKRIIVAGGANDRATQVTDNINNMKAFINHCKQVFPNARIYIGMIGWESSVGVTGVNNRTLILNNALAVYKQCSQYGAIYMNGVENVLHQYNFISGDHLHPNANGYTAIAGALYNCLNGNNYDYVTSINQSTVNGLTFNTQILKDTLNITLAGSLNIDGTTTLNRVSTVGTITSDYFRTIHGSIILGSVYAKIVSNGSTYFIPVFIYVNSNNELVINMNQGYGLVTEFTITASNINIPLFY